MQELPLRDTISVQYNPVWLVATCAFVEHDQKLPEKYKVLGNNVYKS